MQSLVDKFSKEGPLNLEQVNEMMETEKVLQLKMKLLNQTVSVRSEAKKTYDKAFGDTMIKDFKLMPSQVEIAW